MQIRSVVLIGALVWAGIASAEELDLFSHTVGTPQTLTFGKNFVITNSPSWTLLKSVTKEMARILPSGEVQVDWPTVEECAENKKLCGGTVSDYAKLILAAKNGTWKPLHAEKRCIEVDPLADDAGRPSKMVCR